MLSTVISHINNLDSLRLALGLTCVVRVLIVHAELHTLLLNAGFFTYMFLYGLYKAWLEQVLRLDKVFNVIDEDGVEIERWPLTQKLNQNMNSAFFILSFISLTTYYAHVYRQATWKFEDSSQDSVEAKPEAAAAAEGGSEQPEQKKLKTGKKGKKGGK